MIKKYEVIENGILYPHNSFEKCREGLKQAYQNAEQALEDKGHELWQLEIVCSDYDSSGVCVACEVLEEFDVPYSEDEIDESMDGDFDSAMASAGLGTDEDYGCFGDETYGADF
tara:strand:- start:169 stop:510 length:342 start_codon:yes stop_codon:yes gene_type:complete